MRFSALNNSNLMLGTELFNASSSLTSKYSLEEKKKKKERTKNEKDFVEHEKENNVPIATMVL